MHRMFAIALLLAMGQVAAQKMPQWKVAKEISPSISYLLVDRGFDPQKLRGIAESVCSGKPVCIVGIWDDASMIPSTQGMNAAHLNAQLANYNVNKAQGTKSFVPGCRLDKRQC
ncbi:MAG: hypothetical protein JNJ55_04855 [Betaproteobacteria bacterium]|nr:hypothetical protein [Betaproteobacteria bacterium]